MQPLPRKILKTDFLVSENEEDANKNLKKEEKDDDLECDEDVTFFLLIKKGFC